MRRPRLLVIGCGDVGQRAVQALGGRWTVRALTSQPERAADLRQRGITPLIGNLDTPATLRRLGALAPRVLHLAPPPTTGDDDPRTRHLLQALGRHTVCQRLVYGSTTGVYGDTGGARFDETRPVAPANARARRRVAAESTLRGWALVHGVKASILRIPGIYAGDRPGGHPRERLARGTPVLRHEDDVYTNHIHANDLARLCVAALLRGRPQRIWHACDDTELKMGDYFDLAARLCGLPLPRRISREEARTQLSPMLLSFMGESRRLDNQRMKRELRIVLRYPEVSAGLLA
jgi:nucleoside-diphosphate-sugar epimerase